jgi:hypothetical protein
VIVVHLLPNLASPLLVQSTFVFAFSILTEAVLSFLGAGVPPTSPTWGNMIASDAQSRVLQSRGVASRHSRTRSPFAESSCNSKKHRFSIGASFNTAAQARPICGVRRSLSAQ